MLRDIEDEFVSRIDELAHQFHCSLAQPNGMEGDEDRAEYHVKAAKHTFNDIGKLLLPWYKQWEDEGQSLAQMWKNFKLLEKNPVYAASLHKKRSRLKEIVDKNKLNLKSMAELKDRLRAAAKQKLLKNRSRQHAGLSRR